MTDVNSAPGVPTAVGRFLDGIQSGDWSGMAECLTPDVLYDSSTPNWRYQYEGRARVVQEYLEGWTGKHSWRIAEQHVSPTPDGVVIDFEIHGRCPGDSDHHPHDEVCRTANIFVLEQGLIAEHRYYCCGEWDEETLRHIEADAPKVARRRH